MSGLKELDAHGVRDFSLRRVAIDAGVSCAAPYRHFKDKDELISSIISYVLEGWKLLSAQISEVFADDIPSVIAELSVAGLRFWVANGNFRTVLMNASSGDSVMREFDTPITGAVERFCELRGIGNAARIIFKILTMLYGAVVLVDEGYESIDLAAEALREIILSDVLK